MPGLITHYLCAQACLGRLKDTEAEKTISRYRTLYNLGAQGPDVFFYYLPALVRKPVYRLGNTVHNVKVGDFFAAMIAGIAELSAAGHEKDRDAAASYLAGFLTHYALDACAHPYIYYKSGFNTGGGRRNKLKYSVNHRSFETNIDILMLKMASSQTPSDKNLWELVHADGAEASAAAGVLSRALCEVHGIKLSERQVQSAFRGMYALNRVIQSRKGRRKRVMAFVEGFTVRERVLTSIIHDQEADGACDYLNLKKTPWYYPWENDTEHTLAFTDLFEMAIGEAVEMIDMLFAFLEARCGEGELLRLIGNRSMATGMDAGLTLEFKYSEEVLNKSYSLFNTHSDRFKK